MRTNLHSASLLLFLRDSQSGRLISNHNERVPVTSISHAMLSLFSPSQQIKRFNAYTGLKIFFLTYYLSSLTPWFLSSTTRLRQVYLCIFLPFLLCNNHFSYNRATYLKFLLKFISIHLFWLSAQIELGWVKFSLIVSFFVFQSYTNMRAQ
jgi:hypothetical protein